MSRAVKFGVVAVVVFAAGAGLALFQKGYLTQTVAPEPATAPVVETPAPSAAEATPAPAATDSVSTPELEPGKVVEGAPPMPAAAESAPHDHAAAAPVAPVAGLELAGSFALTDQTGKAVTEKSWPGKTKLVFFGYTSCPDICPATLQKLTAVMEALDPQGAKLQPILISVDPATDTPERLSTYLGAYHKSVAGLTGAAEQVDAAKKAYKVYSASNGAGVVDHTSFIYVVSPEEKVLSIMGSNASAEEMTAKIKAALEPVAAP